MGFLDGAKVIKVRMYEGAKETWTEWGRSLDLKDAATPAQVWSDVAFLSAVQGLPLPMAIALEIARLQSDLPLWDTLPLQILFWLNVRSEEHTSELQSLTNLVCRLLLEKKKIIIFPS